MKEIAIRPNTEADFGAMWVIFQELIATGDTYYLRDCLARAHSQGYQLLADPSHWPDA